MKPYILLLSTLLVVSDSVKGQTIWLEELDLGTMDSQRGTPQKGKSVDGNAMSIGGKKFDRGIGTHATSTYLINLGGKAKRFTASVGVDDEVTQPVASIIFYVVADKKTIWSSGVMKKGDAARQVDVDVNDVTHLGLLVTDAGDGISYDHADWCDAKLEFTSSIAPKDLILGVLSEQPILTPKPSAVPRINGAKVFGVRPGNPFLYSIAATGKRPMTFSAQNLPKGLRLDSLTGRMTGIVNDRGTYRVSLEVKNEVGAASRDLRIVVGDAICLTPPMGWNSWNCWACAVDDHKVRAAADAMVQSGLMNHGWTYINIDDCWEIKTDTKEVELRGDARNNEGKINTNKKFPDMRALSDYVHSKGLKLGIYSSPGPETCAGFTGSYQFEEQDARRYAEWGIDYLKYDWCSYGKIAKDRSLDELKRPYLVMRTALDKVPRDIVFSLCQYGMGNVWEWGATVGGNCWRTTGDIVDTWSSMAGIGFNQAEHERYAAPGHWNDPDMLVVGLVGWGPQLHPTRLSPDEQYTHISLWSLLAAPLLIGADMSMLDEFTMNLLTNDEVIEINQDPLGKQARRIWNEDGKEIWAKEMEDGSWAVGLFYPDMREKKSPSDYFTWGEKKGARIVLRPSDLGVNGRVSVRDVWRQKDLGLFEKEFVADVPYHGVVLARVRKHD